MRLCDRLVEVAANSKNAAQLRDELYGALGNLCPTQDIDATYNLAAAVKDTPVRYMLTPEVSAAAWQMAAFSSQSVIKGIEIIRMRVPELWIEWPDRSRREILEQMKALPPVGPSEVIPERVGVYLRATDDTGRRGIARWAWSTSDVPAAISVQTSLLEMHFDLDDPNYRYVDDIDDRYTIGLSAKGEEEHLDPLLGYQAYVLSPEIAADFAASGIDPLSPLGAGMIRQGAKDLGGEGSHLFALLLMLIARNAVDQKPSDLARLNAKREKRGKSPLLDHVELSMSLSRVQARRMASQQLGGTATARRFHTVSGHIRFRGDQAYWWRPYSRGDIRLGVVKRTVTVRR